MQITLTRTSTPTSTPAMPTQACMFASIHKVAHGMALEAGMNALPEPMTVVEADLMGNPIGRSWTVSEGACGFAWITFAGNTPWGKWAKTQGIASKGYPKGLQIWVSEFNQSMARKEAYAYAYAKVLREHGIEAYAHSRMD
jgi:hypothetical protein